LKIKRNLIREKFNIVDYIGRYVHLKRSGRNYVGLCPFHQEKTPSFTVSEDKQFFHCFGCSAGGDLIEFLSKYLNVSPYEAVMLLEKESGLVLIEGDRGYERKQKEIKKILDINRSALAFFVHNLFKTDEGSLCLEYISKRGIKIETVKRFYLGYGSSEWDRLFKYLEKKGFNKNDIEKSGLVVQHSGAYRDLFRKRLIFPIINRYKEVIGFGGRSLDNTLPKYINTPENPVFLKRRNLFGINNALKKIAEQKVVYIVEGYMDCIMMHQEGFENTVATLGTAITEEHVKFLKGFVEKFYLIYDGDEAGRKAALRACEIFINQGISTYIALLPEGEDPDSLLKNNRKDVLLNSVNNAKKSIDFLLDFYKMKHSLLSVDGIRSYLLDIEKHLQNITNPLEKELVYREVAKAVNLTPEELYVIFRDSKNSRVLKKIEDQNALSPEDYVTAFVLNNLEYHKYVTEILDFLPAKHREILDKCISNAIDYLSDDAEILYRKLSMMDFKPDNNGKTFFTNLYKIKLKQIKKLKEELNKKIIEAEKIGDEQEVKKLIKEKTDLVLKEKNILKRSSK
jgi:DNA primase